uniref:non-specific serine/threonine protein kinase n=1 Tax=Alexandrium monilatum TaxID=311494 RepID=A0A7S4VTK5_9DINO
MVGTGGGCGGQSALEAGYAEEGVLGRGAFGVVVRVRRRQDGHACACKRIALGPLSESLRRKALQEAELLRELDSPYVVKYLDSFLDGEELCIVTELCEGGTLAGLLSRQAPGSGAGLAEDAVARQAAQVLLGLAYLHSRRVLHRDVKPANVFLLRGGGALLGDLGVAKVLLSSAEQAHTVVGSPAYMAPELVDARPYGVGSDIWALGCVAYEMCALHRPFEAQSVPALCVKILQGRIPSIPSRYSPQLKALVARCFRRAPSQRPGAAELLRSSPFREVVAKLGAEVPSTPAFSPRVTPRRMRPGQRQTAPDASSAPAAAAPKQSSRGPGRRLSAPAVPTGPKSPTLSCREPRQPDAARSPVSRLGPRSGRSNSAECLHSPAARGLQESRASGNAASAVRLRSRSRDDLAEAAAPQARSAPHAPDAGRRERYSAATGRRIVDAAAAVAKLEAMKHPVPAWQDAPKKPRGSAKPEEPAGGPPRGRVATAADSVWALRPPSDERSSTCSSGGSTVVSLGCSVFAGSSHEGSNSETLMERCERHLKQRFAAEAAQAGGAPGCEAEVTLLPDGPELAQAAQLLHRPDAPPLPQAAERAASCSQRSADGHAGDGSTLETDPKKQPEEAPPPQLFALDLPGTELDSLALSSTTVTSTLMSTVLPVPVPSPAPSPPRWGAGRAFAAACAGARVKSAGEMLSRDIAPGLLEDQGSDPCPDQGLSLGRPRSLGAAWEPQASPLGPEPADDVPGMFGMSLGAVCSLLAGEAALRSGADDRASAAKPRGRRRRSSFGSNSEAPSPVGAPAFPDAVDSVLDLSFQPSFADEPFWEEPRSASADGGPSLSAVLARMLEASQLPRGEGWSEPNAENQAMGSAGSSSEQAWLDCSTFGEPAQGLARGWSSSRFELPTPIADDAPSPGKELQERVRRFLNEAQPALTQEGPTRALGSALRCGQPADAAASGGDAAAGASKGSWSRPLTASSQAGAVRPHDGDAAAGASRSSWSRPLTASSQAGRRSCDRFTLLRGAVSAEDLPVQAVVAGHDLLPACLFAGSAPGETQPQDPFPGDPLPGRVPSEALSKDPGCMDAALREALPGAAVERLGGGRYRLDGRRVFCRLDEKGQVVARCGARFVPIGQFLSLVAPVVS